MFAVPSPRQSSAPAAATPSSTVAITRSTARSDVSARMSSILPLEGLLNDPYIHFSYNSLRGAYEHNDSRADQTVRVAPFAGHARAARVRRRLRWLRPRLLRLPGPAA